MRGGKQTLVCTRTVHSSTVRHNKLELMFEKAIETAAKFTRPIHTPSRRTKSTNTATNASKMKTR